MTVLQYKYSHAFNLDLHDRSIEMANEVVVRSPNTKKKLFLNYIYLLTKKLL